MSVNVSQQFEGKSIFFTGVTGFVGKVFLYKLLKDCSGLKTIFCLIRTKKGQAPLDRFKVNVMKSECFSPLRKALGEEEFERRASKIVPLAGDMMEENLGLSAADYQRLVDECNYVCHIAATVDFQEKLNISVKMNVLGTLRVVALARKCKNLDAMVHTSTCYVNWNRASSEIPVMERVYELPFDPEEMCKYILALHDEHVKDETKGLLDRYGFPNTYTFTKSMAEQILLRTKGTLPLSIVRPAIVGCSWSEPMPGWCDALTAAGAVLLTGSLGILRELKCDGNYRADMVPVDFVCNTLLKTLVKTAITHRKAALVAPSAPLLTEKNVASISAAPAVASSSGPAKSVASFAPDAIMPFVFHAGTSGSANPVHWRQVFAPVLALWTDVAHPNRVGPIDCKLVPTREEYLFRYYVYRYIPLLAMKVACQLPLVGNAEKRKLLGKYEKAMGKTHYLNFQFEPFTSREWRYDISNTKFLDESLDEQSLAIFSTDVFKIQWYAYFQLYSWGITKFIMKKANREQPLVPPTSSEVFLKANL